MFAMAERLAEKAEVQRLERQEDRRVAEFKARRDDADVHPFELRGLGRAPFTLVRVEKTRGSTCEFCGTAIIYKFWIRSRDGLDSWVGSDCILKLNSRYGGRLQDHTRREVARLQKEREREQIDAAFAKIQFPGKTSMPLVESISGHIGWIERNREILESHPHSRGFRGKSALDEAEWMFAHSGHAGKLRAARHLESVLAKGKLERPGDDIKQLPKDPRIEKLRNAMLQISDKDRNFAESLLRQFDRTGGLTDRQWPWVERLAEKKTEPEDQKTDFGDIFDHLDHAKKHLKYPKVRFEFADGRVFRIALRGDGAVVNLTDGQPYGQSVWYGRIDRKGLWTRPRSGVPEWVEALVAEIAKDGLVAVAKRHGILTGNCCFCRQTLTDERSTEVGYGKKCSENWNLPWGNYRRGRSHDES